MAADRRRTVTDRFVDWPASARVRGKSTSHAHFSLTCHDDAFLTMRCVYMERGVQASS